MASTPPPTIFSDKRRLTKRRRAIAQAGSERFLLDEMVEDVIERLAFLRFEPKRALLLGDASFKLRGKLDQISETILEADIVGYFDHIEFDLERPLPHGPFDLIACFGLLDTVNDLPGTLVHFRNALNPGGLMISQFVGAGSLPTMRSILLEADGERPAARLHPMVDVRAGGQLLQRTGWKDPVVDSNGFDVSYSALSRLVDDLRAHGLTNALASAPPPFTPAQRRKLDEIWQSLADADGRVTEHFEILTLSGWRA